MTPTTTCPVTPEPISLPAPGRCSGRDSARALAPAASDTGDLTLIVRDEDGQRMPRLHLLLFHDADTGARLVHHTQTGDDGQVTFTALPYGIYIVQFHGTLPGGRPMQPAERQNAGLKVDGGGRVNGFGIRLAQPQLTQLFVLIQVHEADPDGPAIPLFDLAASVRERPRPVDAQMTSETVSTTETSGPLVLTVLTRPGRRWMRALLAALGIVALCGGLWSVRHGRQHGPHDSGNGEHHDWTP